MSSTIYNDNAYDDIMDYPMNRSIIYGAGRYWVFYCPERANISYRSSDDNGTTWDSPIVIDSNIYRKVDFSVYSSDGTIIHTCYAREDPTWKTVYYRRGTLNADGTITWDIEREVVPTDNVNQQSYVCVTADSNSIPVIFYGFWVNPDYYQHVVRANDTLGSSWGSTLRIGTIAGNLYANPMVLPDGKLFVTMQQNTPTVHTKSLLYDGSWSEDSSIPATITHGYCYQAKVDLGGTVHYAYIDGNDYHTQYLTWDTISGWGSTVEVDSSENQQYGPIALLLHNDIPYIFKGYSDDIIMYNGGDSWSKETVVTAEAGTIWYLRMSTSDRRGSSDDYGINWLITPAPNLDLKFSTVIISDLSTFEITAVTTDVSYVIRTGNNTITIVADFTDPNDYTAGEYKCWMWFRNNNVGDAYTIGPYEATVGKLASTSYSATLSLDPTTEWVRNYDVSIAVDLCHSAE